MSDGNDQDASCPVCHHVARDGALAPPRRWNWWEIAPAALLALTMVSGWMYSFTTLANDSHALEARVNKLEHSSEVQVTAVGDANTRLARMEPMLKYLVDQTLPAGSRARQ